MKKLIRGKPWPTLLGHHTAVRATTSQTTASRRWTLIWLAGCLVIVGLSSVPSRLYAHGGGTPRLVNEPVGPYLVSVCTQPEPLRAGEVHISVAVVLPDQSQSTSGSGDTSSGSNELQQIVTDARVVITFEPIGAAEAAPNGDAGMRPIAAEAVPQSAPIDLYYEADLELPREGPWQATVEVEGAEGSGSVAFESTVLPQRRFNWSLVAIIILLFSGILVGIGVRARQRPQSVGAGRRSRVPTASSKRE